MPERSSRRSKEPDLRLEPRTSEISDHRRGKHHRQRMIVVQKLWPRNLRFISSASQKPRTTSKKMDQKTKCAVVCIASKGPSR